MRDDPIRRGYLPRRNPAFHVPADSPAPSGAAPRVVTDTAGAAAGLSWPFWIALAVVTWTTALILVL